MKFCSNCGSQVVFKAIEGEHLPRFICENCGIIHYKNPLMVVGCVPIWEDKIMLCRRGIEPQFGMWNLPGGFMENNETVEEGAAREMLEETNGRVKILSLHTVFSVTHVNQVHLHFLANMEDLNYSETPESTEIALFTEGSIPWDEIAFASNLFAIKRYFEDRKNGIQKTHLGALLQQEGKWKIVG